MFVGEQGVLVSVSCFSVGRHVECVNDVDVKIVLCLLCESVDGAFREVMPEFESACREAIERSGPGLVLLDLDSLLRTPARQAEFDRLLRLVEMLFAVVGEQVPEAMLNVVCRIPRVVPVSPYSVRRLRVVLRAFRRLLRVKRRL